MQTLFTKEQINKIEVGKTYSSWKQLCEESGIPYKQDGKRQSYQRMELSRFFEYDKIGRKYQIQIRREFPLTKITASNSPYRKILQILILDQLASSDDNILNITQDKFFHILNMVNNNFGHYRKKGNIEELSDELNINKKTIDMFYMRHSSRFRDIIEGTLNSLKNQFLIDWNKADIMVSHDYSYSTMNDYERSVLLECKSDIAEYLEEESIQSIYLNGKFEEFSKLVVLEYNARTNSDIKYIYSIYHLIYNPDENYVNNKKRSIYDKLKADYRLELQYELNDKIVENILKNARERTSVELFISNEEKLTQKLIKS